MTLLDDAIDIFHGSVAVGNEKIIDLSIVNARAALLVSVWHHDSNSRRGRIARGGDLVDRGGSPQFVRAGPVRSKTRLEARVATS